MRTTRRRVAALLTLTTGLAVLTACGQDEGTAGPASTSTTTSAGAAQTQEPAPAAAGTAKAAAPASSSKAATGTTTKPAAGTSQGAAAAPAAPAAPVAPAAGGTPTVAPAAAGNAAVPSGPGCAPGAELTDGRWFGRVEAVQSASVTFNLMCWFDGDEAVRAAQEDGHEGDVAPDGYYIRDANPQVRTLPLAAGAEADYYVDGILHDPQHGPVAEWWERDGSDGFDIVWLTVEGGQVTAVEEKWVP